MGARLQPVGRTHPASGAHETAFISYIYSSGLQDKSPVLGQKRSRGTSTSIGEYSVQINHGVWTCKEESWNGLGWKRP